MSERSCIPTFYGSTGKAMVRLSDHNARIAELEADRDRLQRQCEVARTTVRFFSSVIKCGEPWTQQCEQSMVRALSPAEPKEPTS